MNRSCHISRVSWRRLYDSEHLRQSSPESLIQTLFHVPSPSLIFHKASSARAVYYPNNPAPTEYRFVVNSFNRQSPFNNEKSRARICPSWLGGANKNRQLIRIRHKSHFVDIQHSDRELTNLLAVHYIQEKQPQRSIQSANLHLSQE